MFYVNEQFGLLLLATSISIAGVFLTFLFRLLQKIPIIEKDMNVLRGELIMFDRNLHQLKSETAVRHDTLDDKIDSLDEKHEQRLNELRLEIKNDITHISGKIDEANKGILEILKHISTGK